MIQFIKSISQCITAASPAWLGWMSFWGMICHAQTVRAFPAYCTCASHFIIFALWNALLAWKACTGSPGESGLALMQMTAAASFTRRAVDRRGNSAVLSGSTAELAGWAAPAINISADNIHSCLFFPKLSVSVTDLLWKWLLFWQILRMTVTVSWSVLLRAFWSRVCQPSPHTPYNLKCSRCTESCLCFWVPKSAHLNIKTNTCSRFRGPKMKGGGMWEQTVALSETPQSHRGSAETSLIRWMKVLSWWRRFLKLINGWELKLTQKTNGYWF